jgi:hypothetical protein
MLKHWSMWFIVIGLGMDILDTFTNKGDGSGGILYGTNGPLAGINNSIPGHLNVGEAIAAVGAVGLFMHHGKG